MYRFNANSRATISSTAIFLSQQSRQYFSSPRGSETSLAPHSAHRALTIVFRGMLQFTIYNSQCPSGARPGGRECGVRAKPEAARSVMTRRPASSGAGRRTECADSAGGDGRVFLALCRLLAALGRLRAVLLREPLDAAFGIDQLLASGKERMAGGTDLEVQLRLGRTRLERVAARAPRLDVEVFRMNGFFHGSFLCRVRMASLPIA